MASVPAVLALLAAGIRLGDPGAAAVAVAAAFTVGFGAFKRVHGSARLAMALAGAGTSASAFAGTLAGQWAPAMLAAVAVWGFVAVILSVLKSDLGWVGQQCTIVLLVAGAFPGPTEQAARRALLVLGGAAVQFASLWAFLRFLADRPAAGPGGLPAAARSAATAVWAEVRALSPTTRRAVRLAVVLAAAVELWRWFHLPNGYWMAMTVLLLVRPDPGGTFRRAAERVAGTVAGAVLATVVISVFRVPAMSWATAALTGVAAGLTLTLQQGNRLGPRPLTYPGSYVVFAACLTAYIVFLLDYGGLSPRGVAEERVLLTAAGGVLALAVHVPLDRLWRRQAASGPDRPPGPVTARA